MCEQGQSLTEAGLGSFLNVKPGEDVETAT